MTKVGKPVYFFILAGILCALNLSASINHNLFFNSENMEVKTSVGEYIITFPTSSDTLPRGGNILIEWTTSTGDAFADINLTFPYGESSPIIIAENTNNDGACAWTIPWSIPEAQAYSIGIYSTDHSTQFGFSSDFHIYPNQTMYIDYPSSLTHSNKWEINTTHSIQYHSDNVFSFVNIELYKNSIFNMTIASSTSNLGQYNWYIPDDLINGTDYQIKVIDAGVGADYNYSEMFELYLSPLNDNTNNTLPPNGDFPIVEITIVAGSVAAAGIVSAIFFQKRKHGRR